MGRPVASVQHPAADAMVADPAIQLRPVVLSSKTPHRFPDEAFECRLTAAGRLDAPAALDQLDDNDDQRDDQEQVDQAARYMEDEPAESPQYDENYCDRPKHHAVS
jgi:hypothetical protein